MTFKYQQSWVQYQDTHYVVKQNWKAHILGTLMHRVKQKLKKIKLDLKTWSKRTFKIFSHKLEQNREKLLEVEQKLLLRSHSAHLNNWHYRLIKQQVKMHLFNQKYWGKLARKEWLIDDDRHSRYFYHTMKARKSYSKIMKIKDASGIWTDEAP